jgi:hypothetical protein
MAEASGAMEELKSELARRTKTDPEDWYLVFKARYGMLAVFRVLREARGDGSVVTQLYTCATAVDPIIAAGLVPVYADIDPDTLSAAQPTVAIGPDTRAIVLQHTFGIIDEASSRAFAKTAHAAGSILMEDCAHCVCRMARDADGAPLADVSIHSFGVEKVLPHSYFGGAVWVNPDMVDKSLRSRIASALSSLPELDAVHAASSRRYHNQLRVLNRLPGSMAHSLRERWIASGKFEPAVADAERRAELPLEPMLPDDWVCRKALSELGGLDDNEATRRACVEAYREELDGAIASGSLRVPAAAFAPDSDGRTQPLLRMPVGLPSEELAEAAHDAMSAAGLYSVRWYSVPLLPGPLDPAAYGIADGLGAWPETVSVGKVALDLPCDVDPDLARVAARITLRAGTAAHGSRG